MHKEFTLCWIISKSLRARYLSSLRDTESKKDPSFQTKRAEGWVPT